MSSHCFKCGIEIKPGARSFVVKITAVSNFDGIIQPQKSKDLNELLKEIEEEIRGLPEDLIEEEIFKAWAFLLFSRCKELFPASPFSKALDDLKPPESIPPP
jgi:hypothetical protein